ncbi:MAG: PilN domain-containing protein [Gammaproteobacteria bacterium]|nr:PilN domain-containing protein [Gammaproteobacteria bacterium]
MAHINLLPWREELRAQQTKEFSQSALIAAMFAGAVFFLIYTQMNGFVDNQNRRNNVLNTEISKLDTELNEIKDLETTKSKLLARMDIIQSLQQKRPQIVHIFDEIVRTVPEGITLVSLEQKADELIIKGLAESNGRVSAYMRNIDASEWMANPRLEYIETKQKSFRNAEFVLKVNQSAPDQKAGES